MTLFLEICFFVLLAYFVFSFFMSRKFYNPYKLFICVGKKGSGKSTLITKLAYKYTKKKRHVYLNCSVNLPKEQMEYIHYIGALDLWKLPSFDSLTYVLLDESGLDFDCRQWDTFPKEMKEFFVYQRKKKICCYLFSQSLDIDKSIRDKSDALYLVQCNNGWLSYARKIKRQIVFTKASDFKGSTITDELRKCFPLLPSSWKITFIPKWTKYFDTNLTMFVASETERKKRK